MEKVARQNEELTAVERFMLLIYLVYSVALAVITLKSGWPAWLAAGTGIGWVCSLLLHLVKFRSYTFRACFTTCLTQISIVLWSVGIADLHMTAPLLVIFSASFVLYGIPQVVYVAAVVTTFLGIYHTLIVHTVDLLEENMLIQTILEMAAVYFVQYIVCFLIKIREMYTQKQMEAFEAIKEAERSKDDFLANVSHEIRTPVNTICGMSEIVLRENLKDTVRADIFSIQTAGRNLLSIVSDVLDFTELQAGRMALAEEVYNITSTLNDIINMSMARIDERQIELIVDCSASIPSSMIGDEQKIRRVIINLVNNALKFTSEGCVSLILHARPTEYGVNLIVRVKDTGIGMKEESLEKLFTSFNQVDTRRNRQEGGIGLGLAVSQAMIDAMGGFITVSSEYGKGSEIQFVIPQKVVDAKPIAAVSDLERIRIAIYIDMEKYGRPDVRREYGYLIYHMIDQLKVKCRACQNLEELKRRAKQKAFTHVFVGIEEYEEDTAYFDELSKTVKVIAVIDRAKDAHIQNGRIQRLYKPFFILPVVMILNEEKAVQRLDSDYAYQGKFIAPDVNVLVVDDNLMNIRVLEGLLAPYKIKVSMAMSGAEALEKIDTMGYDAVLMDHMMPEIDGVETLHRIRQKQGNYFKKIPVIAVTANAISGMREVFLREGFQDFMAKPIEVSVLERVLRRNLPQEKLIFIEETDNDTNKNGAVRPKSQDGKAETSSQNQEKAADAQPRATDLPVECFHEEMGIQYCGGLENYIRILQLNSENGPEDLEKIQHSYEQADWKNYAILVHALKSSMLSIGVEKLSGMAKELERAGKSGDQDYIQKHHEAMTAEYRHVLKLLLESRSVHPEAGSENIEGMEALEEAQLDRLALEFEDAAYAFDEKQMSIIAEFLGECSYNGHALKESMEPILRKIEMSDYLSASKAVYRLKEKLGAFGQTGQ